MSDKFSVYAIKLNFVCGEDIKNYLENQPPLETIFVNFPQFDNNIYMIDIASVEIKELDRVPTKLDL